MLAAAWIIMAAGSARAQDMDAPDPAPEPQHSRIPPGAIVQPLDTGPGAELRRNLTTLAENPRSLEALIGAGRAAAGMGDGEAALGFFARADEISPGDARIKAGMASALVLMERPEQALLMFAEATQLGAPEAGIAGDRGLAYDMIGDPARAQRDYQLALRRRADPEVERRLALSLAISGQRDQALRAIEGQLRRQERAAWRTQAFVLALTGDAAGAEDTAARMMPAVNAREMAPFFARLPALSPGQKAAAVHFGRIPSDGRNVQIAANAAAGPPVEAAPRRVLPEPEPSSGIRRRSSSGERPINSLIRDSEIAPPVLPSRPVQTAEAQSRRFEPTRDPDPEDQPRREPPPREAPAFYSGGNFTLAPGSEPRSAPPLRQTQPPRPAFSDIASVVQSLPDEGARPAPAPAQVADRRARDAAARAAEARYQRPAATPSRATRTEQPGRGRNARNAPPPNPARRWVQVATGANRTGLPRTFANLREQAGALLGNRGAYTARASTTNRLLVGPFDSDRAAQAFVNQLRQRRIAAVTWTSEAGQEIERLQTANDRSPSRTRSEPERRPAAAARSARARSEPEPRPNASARSTRGRPEVERRTSANDSRSTRATRGRSGEEQRPAARGRRSR